MKTPMRPRQLSLALTLVASFGAPQAIAQQADTATASAADKEYEDCLAQTQTAPEAARERAAQWENTGGGSKAKHCAAIALIAMGAERRAAILLTEIGGEGVDLSEQDRAGALKLAGEIWLRVDQPKMAMKTFERAHKLATPTLETRIGLARAYAEQEEWKKALAELDAALTLDPLDVEAMVLRAATYRSLDDPEAAMLDAARATDLAPGSPLAWFERGAASRAKGEKDAAEKSWLNASMLDPTGPVGDMARFNLQKMILEK